MRYLLVFSLMAFVVTGCDNSVTSDNCGDGVVDIGEECDGQSLAGNYCQALGYYGGVISCNDDCTLNLLECKGNGFCGDNVIQADNEKCDGDNLLDVTCVDLGYPGGTLGCESDCRYDISQCEGADLCGNGSVESPEQCDGTELNGYNCAALDGFEGGALTCGTDCRFNTSGCYTAMVCGDGEVTGDEKCDGDNLQGQSCETLGFDGGTLSCNSFCLYNTDQCEGAGTCGDGEVQINEFCDGSGLNGETCLSRGYYGGDLGCKTDCTFDESPCEAQGKCGDGIIQEGYAEECDGPAINGATCESLGHGTGELTCTANCRIDISTCSGVCGNNTIESDETCDGTDLGNITCEILGFLSGDLHCDNSCEYDTSACVQSDICGNNIVDSGEECDASNLDSMSCDLLGFHGGELSCNNLCMFDLTDCETYGRCGDGLIQSGESCDGSSLNGASCGTEGYYEGDISCTTDCNFDLSSCTGTCGDGVIQDLHGETCDGTNLNSEDCTTLGYDSGTLSCNSSCSYDFSNCTGQEVCGNGIAQDGELCDGTDLKNMSCELLGYYGGDLTCTGGCFYDISDCQTYGMCGDGSLDSDFEECDLNVLGNETCNSLGYYSGDISCNNDCTYDIEDCINSGRCGDSIAQIGYGEDCDNTDFNGEDCVSLGLGYSGGSLSCDSNCTFNYLGCTHANTCGDNIVQNWESCDGTQLKDVTCLSLGFWGGEINCDANCDYNTTNCYGVINISAGTNHVCVLNNIGNAWCWGLNNYGQLGNGTTIDSTSPVSVTLPPNRHFTKITAGHNITCGIDDLGNAWCWGAAANEGKLGNGTINYSTPLPEQVQMPNGRTFVDIAASKNASHVCAIDNLGFGWCWGGGTHGEIGNGELSNQSIPVPVNMPSATIFISIDVSQKHSAAIDSAGNIWQWGYVMNGSFGCGCNYEEVPVSCFSTQFQQLSIGMNYGQNYAIDFNGDIWVWGADNGLHILPRPQNGSIYSKISTYYDSWNNSVYAIDENGLLYYINSGYGGSTSVPHSIDTCQSVSAISTASNADLINTKVHRCYLSENGGIYCWGDNTYGQLGDGTTTSSSTPIPVLSPY